MKTKSQLADKFSGPSSLLYQSSALEITTNQETSVKTFTVTPELDVPCKVDSLNFEQGEADVEKYKVIGLAGAWITDNDPGEVDYSFRVPSISEDILKLAFGEVFAEDYTIAARLCHILYHQPANMLHDKGKILGEIRQVGWGVL